MPRRAYGLGSAQGAPRRIDWNPLKDVATRAGRLSTLGDGVVFSEVEENLCK
jgi:hypothetical protein